jgi:predicted phage terminase large subunit-like protein
MYIPLGGVPIENPRPLIKFPSGAKITFAHLQLERDKYAWQGSQLPLLCWDEITHFCLTPDTEVLTADGWKLISDVKKGEKVPSLSQRGNIVIKEVLDTPSFDYNGELINVFQTSGISARMTPNHRVPVRSQAKNKKILYKFVPAEHMENKIIDVVRCGTWKSKKEIQYKHFKIPTGQGLGKNINAVTSVPMDDWLEFLGWYLSEGSSFLASKSVGGTSPCVSIRQTKENKSLANLMQRLPWRVRSDGDGGYRIFSRQLYDELHPLGNLYQKRIPRFVFTLSKRQMKILFDAFVAGDGYISKSGGYQIGLANDGLIDDFTELAFYLGYSATKRSGITKTGYKYYQVYICEKRFTQVKPKNVKREYYKGKVHCLVVADNHTFFIRHKGRTHWTGNSSDQFWYMLSRNRSTCGVRPYIRGTTNPDADSWVAKFIQWYWDPETGYAIPERSGKIRYFTRMGDEIIWGNTPDEVVRQSPDIIPEQVKSFSFIASKLSDNKILMEKDPGYLGALRALGNVERERLENGNWLIRPAAGAYFKRSQVQIVNAIPHNVIEWVRSWDLAATVPSTANPDPDATAGVLMGRLDNGMFIVADVKREQVTAHEVRNLTRNTAVIDSAKHKYIRITVPQDPGQAGKEQAASYIKHLAGFNVTTIRPSGNKVTRAEPFSAQWQAGNVLVLAGDWNERYFSELEAFPESVHDDMVDASSDAFNTLATTVGWGGFVS